MVLGNRLKAIADAIPKCTAIADIGTDHAYIPIYCLKNGICKRAYACDVKNGPLLIAKKNILRHGLESNISARLSNGLENMEKGEADVFVIAGMGGVLISEILKAGRDKITGDTVLILQPMAAVEELRAYLYENGYNITDEILCREDKIYNIMKVSVDKTTFDYEDILIGKHLHKEELFKDYIAFKKGVNDKIIKGMEKSSVKNDLQEYKKRDEIYKKYM